MKGGSKLSMNQPTQIGGAESEGSKPTQSLYTKIIGRTIAAQSQANRTEMGRKVVMVNRNNVLFSNGAS